MNSNLMELYGSNQAQNSFPQMNIMQQNENGGQMEPPPKKRLQLKIQNEERGFYSALHSQADPSSSNKLSGKDACAFFTRSGLPKQVLKDIWEIASFNGEYLDRDEFYVFLRLISYAQNNIPVDEMSIKKNIPAPLPKIGSKQQTNQNSLPQQNQNERKHRIDDQIKQNYTLYFEKQDQQKLGYIGGDVAKQLFLKSNLPKPTLKAIWMKADNNQSGNLNKEQFIVAIHLIQLAKQGVDINSYEVSEAIEEFMMSCNTGPATGGDLYGAFDYIQPSLSQSQELKQETHFNYSNNSKNEVAQNNFQQQQNFNQPEQNKPRSQTEFQQNFQNQNQFQQKPPQEIQKQTNCNNFQELNNAQKPSIIQIDQDIQQKRQQVEQESNKAHFQFQILRQSHESVLNDKKEEVQYLNKLFDAFSSLSKKIQEENQYFEKEVQKIEDQKGQVLLNLSQLGKTLNEQIKKQTQLREQIQNSQNQNTNAMNSQIQKINQVSQQLNTLQILQNNQNTPQTQPQYSPQHQLQYQPQNKPSQLPMQVQPQFKPSQSPKDMQQNSPARKMQQSPQHSPMKQPPHQSLKIPNQQLDFNQQQRQQPLQQAIFNKNQFLNSDVKQQQQKQPDNYPQEDHFNHFEQEGNNIEVEIKMDQDNWKDFDIDQGGGFGKGAEGQGFGDNGNDKTFDNFNW